MSFTSVHRSAVNLLSSWSPPSPDQDSVRHAFLAFLAARPDGCMRACEPGHVTASAFVVNETHTHTLLTLHPRVGAWIQLGGHCENDDETIVDAALREATEESGLRNLRISAYPLVLHTHPITCSLGLPTRHLDIEFLVIAGNSNDSADDTIAADSNLPAFTQSDESDDLRWWPLDALPDSASRSAAALADRHKSHKKMLWN